MLRIPDSLLPKLICIKCGGYLSSKPVMVNKVNQQVCGKCFNKLTIHEQKTYFRQVAFEALAEHALFPCRFRPNGCQYQYNWHGVDNHEAECPFSFNDMSYNSHQETEYASVNSVRPLLVEKRWSSSDSNKSNYANIKESTYGKFVSTYPVVERCSNCNNTIDNTTLYHCLYGHFTCEVCKGDLCQKCDKIVLKNKGFRCLYFNNGCRALLLLDDVKKHETNCDFKMVKCPEEKCSNHVLVKQTVEHFLASHRNLVMETNEITATFKDKDQHYFMLYKNHLFYVKYYCYDSDIEFLVEFIGNNDEASVYKYKVEFLRGNIAKQFTTRSAQCMGWNTKFLDKGIVYSVAYDQVLNFTAKLSISEA